MNHFYRILNHMGWALGGAVLGSIPVQHLLDHDFLASRNFELLQLGCLLVSCVLIKLKSRADAAQQESQAAKQAVKRYKRLVEVLGYRWVLLIRWSGVGVIIMAFVMMGVGTVSGKDYLFPTALVVFFVGLIVSCLCADPAKSVFEKNDHNKDRPAEERQTE